LILLVLAASGQAFAFGIAVSPTTVEMVANPGSQHRQTITVQNVHAKKTMNLTVGVADWVMSDSGELELLPPGTEDESATDWVRFSPAFFTLKPGEVKQIQVDFDVPIKINNVGERRMGILISTMLPAKNKRPDGSGVWNRYQIASLFYVALPGAEQKTPVVTSVALTDQVSLVPVVEFTVENPGDYHARLKGQLVLIDKEHKQVFEMPVEGVLMARQTRSFKLPVMLDDSGLSGGQYKVGLKLENSFSVGDNASNQVAVAKVEMPTVTVADSVISLK
jgi:P pilus assembly chaperone PapD